MMILIQMAYGDLWLLNIVDLILKSYKMTRSSFFFI